MSKNTQKKSLKQKRTLTKVPQNFDKGIHFYYFQEILKMKILKPKRRFFCREQKKEVKKVLDSNIALLKVVQNFANWATIFISFDKISK